MTPFIPIGKAIERRAQEGEDLSVLGSTGPIKYHRQQRPGLAPPMLGSSSEHDVFRCGSSCESLGHPNMPLSDSFRANVCILPPVRGWRGQWKNWSAGGCELSKGVSQPNGAGVNESNGDVSTTTVSVKLVLQYQ